MGKADGGDKSQGFTIQEFSSKPGVYVLVLGGTAFFVIALVKIPDKSTWIEILFSLPVIAQLVGGFFHIRKSERRQQNNFKGAHVFYYFSMALSTFCIGAYCVLWIVWYSNDKGGYKYLSWLSLGMVAGLLIVIGYMMSAFMKEPDSGKKRLLALREGAAREPLWAMSFLFFVIFLDVTYLFGFAFAFHDKQRLEDTAHNAPALRMVNYEQPDPTASSTIAAPKNPQSDSAERLKGNDAAASQPVGNDRADDEDSCYYFFFDPGQAQLRTAEDFDYERCGLKLDEVSASLSDGTTPTPAPPVGPPQRSIWLTSWFMGDQTFRGTFNQQFNRCSMERLHRRIAQETRGDKQARIVLVGQGDNRPIDLHYKSNYELSDARLQTIRYRLTEALKTGSDSAAWHNLEWLTLPASDEDLSDEVLVNIFANQKKLENEKRELKNMNKRVVIASVVPIHGDLTTLQMQQQKRKQFKELTLLDYMYFSIYTITTTGYGDIIPTTAYAKFVISVANICEVLFLVVFFNALVSIRGDKRKL